jgi:hypothetical protein
MLCAYNSLIFKLLKKKGGNKLTQQIVSFESMDETIHSQYFNTCEIFVCKKQKVMKWTNSRYQHIKNKILKI